MTEKLIIVGSGPAGLTAALYAARAALEPLVLEGPQPGGQLVTTSIVENWPGIQQIEGPALMRTMRSHALSAGARLIGTTAQELIIPQEGPFRLRTKREELTAAALIIATGATSRKLGCPGEADYWGKGVSTCATCDGPLYRDRKVMVLGGGDSALENALFMANLTRDVTLVHITPELTGSAVLRTRALEHPNITVLPTTTITQIAGNGQRVTEVTLRCQKTGTLTACSLDGLFISIGLIPNSSWLGGQLALTSSGHIKCEQFTHTSTPGVFAAGDIVDPHYRQAISSAGSGCMAALDAEKYFHTKQTKLA